MNRLPFSRFGSLVLLVLGVCLSSCATSSERFVSEIRGYSVTRGRITRIENLHAEQFRSLSDGVAMTLVNDDCSVTMQFHEGEDGTRVFDVGEGVILVRGYDSDYILESRSEESDVAIP